MGNIIRVLVWISLSLSLTTASSTHAQSGSTLPTVINVKKSVETACHLFMQKTTEKPVYEQNLITNSPVARELVCECAVESVSSDEHLLPFISSNEIHFDKIKSSKKLAHYLLARTMAAIMYCFAAEIDESLEGFSVK